MKSVVSIWMWYLFEEPDFLYRGNDLDIVTVFNTIAGAGIGLIFGEMMYDMVLRKQTQIRVFAVYVSLMVLGGVVYCSYYWILFRFRPPIFFVDDVLLAVAGLILANFFKTNKTKHQNAIKSAQCLPPDSSCTAEETYGKSNYCDV